MNTIPAASLSPRNPTTKTMNSSLINTEENRKAPLALDAVCSTLAPRLSTVFTALFSTLLLLVISASPVRATSNSWNTGVNGNWDAAGSWLGGVNIPGSTTTDNMDIATFSFTLTGNRTVTVDTDRYIGGIDFGNTSNFGYTLSNGTLHLNSGGVIQTLAGNGNHNDTITAPITISGASGATATFTANATSASSLLKFGVSSGTATALNGSASTGNTTVLTLNGTNTGFNTINSAIGDGVGGGKLAVVKDGSGTWELNTTGDSGAANSYSGGTTLNAGLLRFGKAGSFGTGALTINGGSIDAMVAITTTTLAQIWSGDFTFVGSNAWNANGGGVTLGGNSKVTVSASALTIGGSITDGSNDYSLTKAGAGTLVLSTSNTISGNVTVAEGTLRIGNASGLNVANVVTVGGSGAAPVLDINKSNTIAGLNDGGFTNGTVTNTSTAITLTLGGSGTYSYGGNITATTPANMSVTKSGSGTQTLGGINTYTGATTVSGGTLEIKSGASALAQTLGVLTLAGADVTLKSNKSGAGALSTTFTTLTARTAGNTANIVSSGGTPGTDNSIILTRAAGFIDKGVYFNGADFASMNAANTYVRALAYGTDPNAAAVNTILSGNHTKLTSTPGSQNSISLLSLNLSGSDVSWTNNASQTLTVPGIIKSGGGTQSTISGGNLTGGSNTELVIRTDTAADLLAISSNLTQGSGVLTKSGAGTLTLSGTNTFTGQTYVNGGTLSIGANVNLGAQTTGAQLNLRGGTLQATNSFGLYNGSAGTNNRAVVLTNAAGFDVTSSNTLTVAGVVSGSGSLTKSGTGTQILSGTNTYTGTTTVSVGTLLINGNSSAATGTISVSNGAILGGAGTVGAAVISAGTLSPGDGTTAIGAFTATALTLNTGANFKFDLGGSNTSDRIVLAGAFTRGTGTSFSVNFNNTGVADSTYILATFASLAGGFTAGDVSNFTYTGLAGGVTSGTFGLTGTDLTFTTVPEPSTWALLAFSLTVVTVLRRRRNS